MIACEKTPLPPRISQKSGFYPTSSDTLSTILDPVNQQFTTQDQKPCNGLKRWYEPTTGKWHSNDPIGISGGLNQYLFCDNNPVNFVDPFGLDNLILVPMGTKEYFIADLAGKGKGEFTVAAHGNRYGIKGPHGISISAADLAKFIKGRCDYDPTKPVRLNACETGGETDDGSDNFAQQLANELGNTVIAPTEIIARDAWFLTNIFTGRTYYEWGVYGGTTFPYGGKFTPFYPRK